MDLANIIALVSSHNADPNTVPDMVEEETTTTVVKRGAIVEKVEASPNREPGKGLALPERNTLDAKGFMAAVRKAKSRDEVIQAIHAYIGYNNRRDFGSQEQEARAQAMRDLRGVAPGPTREEKRSAERSLSGFVAGMPQPSQRILSNLRARETAAVEAMLSAKSDSERASYKSVLKQIQDAIDEMVG